MTYEFETLREYLVKQFVLGVDSLHGPKHWAQVERNGLLLAHKNGADEEVVRLFALFHDACRCNEDSDPEHGVRGAALARKLRGMHFDLRDDQFALLDRACAGHTRGDVSDDITIGTCWDADRLDLVRLGVLVRSHYLSTEEAHKLVSQEKAPVGTVGVFRRI